MWQYAAGRPLVFTHIPKTAGTALSEALITATAPAKLAHGFGGVALGHLDALDTVDRRLRAEVITGPDDIPADAEYVTGHLETSTSRARFPGGWHMTVLREPRVRLLSLWLFARTRPGRWSKAWGAYSHLVLGADQPLHEYLGDPRSALAVDNMAARMLLWPHPLVPNDDFIDPANDEEVLEAARERLASYAFVGVVEDPDMTRKLEAALGVGLDLQRRQENTPLPKDRRPDVRAEAARAEAGLDRCTRLDRLLWQEAYAAAVPGADPAAVADATYEQALERYVALTHGPPPPGALATVTGMATRKARRVIMGAARSRR